MISKRYESTEADRRNWSTSRVTHQVVEIPKDTSTKMYTPF